MHHEHTGARQTIALKHRRRPAPGEPLAPRGGIQQEIADLLEESEQPVFMTAYIFFAYEQVLRALQILLAEVERCHS